MIKLRGHIAVPRAHRPAVAAALDEHIRLTRAEPGCLRFDVVPDPTRPGRYAVAEDFRTRADLERHQQRIKGTVWAAASAGAARHYQIEETLP